MRKWQKTWLTLLASSLAIGWIAQGEAAVIKIERVNITQAQPIQVIIIDSSGRIFEETIYYNPSIGGIEIDTRWAGPNTSIFIPALGIGYIWHNGYWVDQEGYYWDGTQRVAVSNLPQWREHWSHYWHTHHIEGFHGGDSWQGGREGRWQGREGGWDRGDRWQGGDGDFDRGDRWQGRDGSFDRGDREGGWSRGDGWRGDQTGTSGAYQGGQAGTMRSTSGYQSSDSMPSSGQTGTMRSAGGFQGGQSDGMTPGGQGGAMRSAGGPQGGAASSGSGMSGSSRSAK